MVKYRLSTPGMSRSCSRVMSPAPAFSILMTFAPSHASSWVQVGPDCTCVKSRMRTPSSALLIRDFPPRSLVHRLVLGAGSVLARIDPDVDDRGAARLAHRLAGAHEGGRDLRGIAHFLAVATEHFRELAARHGAQQGADAAALLAVLGDLAVADLVHGRVVADHGDVRHAEAIRRLHVEGRHAEGAVAVVAEHFLLRVGESCRDGKARADPQR